MSTTEKPEEGGRSGDESSISEPATEPPQAGVEHFKCTGENCLASEIAEHMLVPSSCDPITVTVEELRRKALCMSCAVANARRRGRQVVRREASFDNGPPMISKKDVTAPGNGFHSLARLLMAMRRNDPRVTAGNDGDVYACSVMNCNITGPAQEMFNRPCDMSLEDAMEQLRRRICCRTHAEEIAKRRTEKPGCANSGTFRLSETLRRIRLKKEFGPGLSRQERHDQEYLDWYMNRPIVKSRIEAHQRGDHEETPDRQCPDCVPTADATDK